MIAQYLCVTKAERHQLS